MTVLSEATNKTKEIPKSIHSIKEILVLKKLSANTLIQKYYVASLLWLHRTLTNIISTAIRKIFVMQISSLETEYF